MLALGWIFLGSCLTNFYYNHLIASLITGLIAVGFLALAADDPEGDYDLS